MHPSRRLKASLAVLLLAAGGSNTLLMAQSKDAAKEPAKEASNAPAKEAAKAPGAKTAATVNGKAISSDVLDLYANNVARQANKPVTPEQRGELLDQLINMQLTAEAAEKSGLAESKQVRDQLALARMNILVEAGIEKYLKDNPVKDSELKPEYDAQIAALPPLPNEYKARHILVDDRATAEGIIKELKGGADFAKLAAAKSKDPSKDNGGDLGWFTPDSMVKPFSDAVATLQKGKYTETPVQTQFGWHVIQLEDTRKQTPPTFDQVKDQVKVIVQRKRVQTYIESLRKNAKIEKKS
jgi:peptidyl-prolyl cis-trans isomerase C